MKIKKVLVLGSSGFLGSSLSKELKKFKNYEVYTPLKKKLNLLKIDQIRKFILKKKFDYIVNCAADVGSVHYVKKNSANVFFNNLTMNLNLYNVVGQVSKKTLIINIYSNCCYDEKIVNHYENKFLYGNVHSSVFAYGNFKRTLFIISKVYRDQYDIQSINLMFPSLYGPGDSIDPYKTHAMNGIIIRAIENKINNQKIFKIWGSGKPKRNWLYIDDAVESIILSIKYNLINSFPINIVSEKAISIKEIAMIVLRKIDKKMKISIDLSYSDGSKARYLKPGLFKKKFPNFKFTNYQTGISKTISYYKKIINAKN